MWIVVLLDDNWLELLEPISSHGNTGRRRQTCRIARDIFANSSPPQGRGQEMPRPGILTFELPESDVEAGRRPLVSRVSDGFLVLPVLFWVWKSFLEWFGCNGGSLVLRRRPLFEGFSQRRFSQDGIPESPRNDADSQARGGGLAGGPLHNSSFFHTKLDEQSQIVSGAASKLLISTR